MSKLFYGEPYVIPVQAKGGADKIGRAQLEQDIAYCVENLPNLICCPVAAQFMEGGVIALFHLTIMDDKVQIVQEKHYKLVPASEVTMADLQLYQRHSP